MNNLTTRKIVLGMLMTLVLGFGVQGVAEAIQNPNTGDEANVNTISTTIFNVGQTTTISSISLTPDRPDSRETVSISKTPGIDLIGDFYQLSGSLTENEDLTADPPTNGSAFTYTAGGRTRTTTGLATGEITISFKSKGIQSVTISSTDNDDGADGTEFRGRWSAKYTYYVKGPGTSTTTVALKGLSNGYRSGLFSGTEIEVHSGDSGHYDVTYTTVPTGGTAKIEDTQGDLPASATAFSGSTSSAFDVWLTMDATRQVNVKVRDSDITTTGTYIIGSPELAVGSPGDANRDGVVEDTTAVGNKEMGGRINQVLTKAFSARVTDGGGSAVPGVVVTFRVRGSGNAGGYLVFNEDTGSDIDAGTSGTTSAGNNGFLVSSSNRRILNANGRRITEATDTTLYVRTDTAGIADVDFQLGTDRKQDVTVSAVRQTKTVSAYAGDSVSGNQLVEPSSVVSRALGRAGEYELRVKAVDEDRNALSGETVEFRTSDGELEDPATADSKTNIGHITVETDTQGKAFVFFDPGDSSSPRVTAHLLDLGDDDALGGSGVNADKVVDDVVFNIGGTVTRRDPPPSGGQPARLDISVFGEDGDTSRAVIVNALNSAGQAVSISIPVTLSGSALVTSQTVNTGAVTTITPPTTPGSYTLIATDPAGNYASDTETITVGGPAGEGTLDVTTVGVPVNNQQTIEVTLEDADGDAPAGEVVVTLTGPGISRTVDTLNGTGRAIIPLPNTATYTLRLSADGYATRSVTLSVSGVVQDDTETQTRDTTPGGGARSVRIASDPFPSGTANRQLAQPLRVQVLDANNRGVASVRVTFEVVSGQGRLSQRGDGLGIRAQTDRNGNASANYTPLADGTSTVRATAAGVTQTVTFTITAGAAAPSPDDTTPSDTGVTPSREINPDVHVRAAQRPPMLWVDGGKIYALVGADVEEFGSGVEGAMNIAVGGGKVYWTEMTGESSGTINSAKLDGSDVKELKKIKAVPMGIAVDTAGDKLYWTNSRGRIQSADLDGSGIENVMLDLPGPMDIAVARGLLYWTQYDATEEEGNVGIVNPTAGRKVARYISTGSDMPGSIVIGGNKVYWTEMTGSNAGTINSASLNGSGATELNDIRAVPMGIGVDTARSKLYWTNSRGRVQSANLEGRKIEKIVDGLGNPGDMVLSNSITAPAKAPTTDAEQTASTSKYDINGDGSVDSKDVDALIVAVAAGVRMPSTMSMETARLIFLMSVRFPANVTTVRRLRRHCWVRNSVSCR